MYTNLSSGGHNDGMKPSRLLCPRFPKTAFLIILVLIVGICLTFINIYYLQQMQKEHWQNSHYKRQDQVEPSEGKSSVAALNRPIFWIKANNAYGGYLDHVIQVLRRLGYVEGDKDSRWSFLWAHDYPFMDNEMRSILLSLLPHQKVNHIPGSGYYTSKVNLATSNISGVPVAFTLPQSKDAFLQYANLHKDKYWVMKDNRHRGIKITKVADLDLSQPNSFVQEYVSNPLLIDKRKFDIGIYTVITSVQPLRVYTFDGEALLRFCPEDYHPFDPNNLNKYVVHDDYTPIWSIPSLSKYYTEYGYSRRESLNAYLRSVGKNPNIIWDKISQTIRTVLFSKQNLFLDLLKKYKYPWNFFEMSRFDFVVDVNLDVFLMEANMSPNLSSEHFPGNRLLYEQVIFNLFAVVGVSSLVHNSNGYSSNLFFPEELQMQVADKDIFVFSEQCLDPKCAQCSSLTCKLCNPCITNETKVMLRSSYIEHTNRQAMRRVVPTPLTKEFVKNDELFLQQIQSLSQEQDQLIALWFKGKCLQDETWCR